MKILLSGYKNPHFATITDFCENACLALGHQVDFYNDRQHPLPALLRRKISLLKQLDIRILNQKIIAHTALLKPEIFLALGGTRIMPWAVSALRQKGIKTVLWTVDAPVDFSSIRAAAPQYDFVFCGGSEAEEILQQDGVEKARWLPFACDPDSYHSIALSDDERKKFGHDILFIGSFYPNRWEILRQLTGFNVGIYGPGWAKGDASSIETISIQESQVPFDAQLALYASAKIVVIVHYQDGKTPCYQASPKVYEALACKSFVLVDRQKDVFSLFKDGRHLAGFDSVEDLKKKVHYYLENSEERRSIAEQGYSETIAKHSYLDRIRQMISVITEHK